MGKSNKNPKRHDLLKMSSQERKQFIEKIRSDLERRLAEAKLWHSLIEAEMVTINGNTILLEQDSLKGLQITSNAF